MPSQVSRCFGRQQADETVYQVRPRHRLVLQQLAVSHVGQAVADGKGPRVRRPVPCAHRQQLFARRQSVGPRIPSDRDGDGARGCATDTHEPTHDRLRAVGRDQRARPEPPVDHDTVRRRRHVADPMLSQARPGVDRCTQQPVVEPQPRYDVGGSRELTCGHLPGRRTQPQVSDRLGALDELRPDRHRGRATRRARAGRCRRHRPCPAGRWPRRAAAPAPTDLRAMLRWPRSNRRDRPRR